MSQTVRSPRLPPSPSEDARLLGSLLAPRRPPLWKVALWMAAAATIGVKMWAIGTRTGSQVDVDVYLSGARALLHGDDLYGVSVHGLQFTYSPFGAVVFIPLTPLPLPASRLLLLLLSLACLVLVLAVVARRLRIRPTTVTTLALVTGLSEPLYRGLLLGQINMVLMAMVVLDLLVLPRGRQGLLVGLAAGIKVVPGIFVVYFLLRRDWRGVALSATGFVTSVLVGGVFDPGGSRWYWSGGVMSLNKFGTADVFASDNQSLSSFIDRVIHASALPTAASLVGCAVGVGLAGVAARRALRRRDDIAAVLALAMGGLLASPVSWTHHWIWFAPVCFLLAARRHWVALWTTALVFVMGPMWFLPVGSLEELHYAWWQTGISGAYTVTGLSILVGLGWRWTQPRPPDRTNGVLPGGEGRHSLVHYGHETRDGARVPRKLAGSRMDRRAFHGPVLSRHPRPGHPHRWTWVVRTFTSNPTP